MDLKLIPAHSEKVFLSPRRMSFLQTPVHFRRECCQLGHNMRWGRFFSVNFVLSISAQRPFRRLGQEELQQRTFFPRCLATRVFRFSDKIIICNMFSWNKDHEDQRNEKENVHLKNQPSMTRNELPERRSLDRTKCVTRILGNGDGTSVLWKPGSCMSFIGSIRSVLEETLNVQLKDTSWPKGVSASSTVLRSRSLWDGFSLCLSAFCFYGKETDRQTSIWRINGLDTTRITSRKMIDCD